MKWILSGLYMILVLFISLVVFDYAKSKKSASYYNDNAVDVFNENNMTSYLSHFMTANEIKYYLKDPIYTVTAQSNKESISFSIYQFKTDKSAYLAFFIHNLKIDINSQANGINFKMYMDSNDKPIIDKFSIDIHSRMPLILLETKESESEYFYYEKSVDNKVASEKSKKIDRIELKVDDSQLELLIPSKTHFSSTDNAVIEQGVFHAQNFNGEYKTLNKNDYFKDETKLGNVHTQLFETYSYIYHTIVTTYIILLAVITYLIFFLRKTIELISDYRARKIKSKENGDNI